MIDAAIDARAPGGVIMRLYSDDELVVEQPLVSSDLDITRLAAEYSGDLALARLNAGAQVVLAIYDGDDGILLAGTIVTPT